MKKMDLKHGKNINIVENRKKLEKDVYLFKMPYGVKKTAFKIGDIGAEWLLPKKHDEKRVIMYLHGGAYIAGSPKTHRTLAARIAKKSESKALIIDYRLAPENPFPAAVDDAETAYKWLLKQGYISTNIVFAGDSAGGGLTLATMLKLRDEKIPLPGAAVCLSPWTDLAITGDSVKLKKNEDLMLTEHYLKFSAEKYVGNNNPKNPYISPLYAELKGLPPILIQTGTADLIVDDALRFVENAKKSGLDITLDLWQDMFHVFQIFGWYFPESKTALKKIGNFIKEFSVIV